MNYLSLVVQICFITNENHWKLIAIFHSKNLSLKLIDFFKAVKEHKQSISALIHRFSGSEKVQKLWVTYWDLPCHDTQAQTAAGTPESQHDQLENHPTLKPKKSPSEQCPLHWAEVGLQGEQNTDCVSIHRDPGPTCCRESSNHGPFYKYWPWSSTPSRIFKPQHRDPGDQYFSWQPPELLLRILGEAIKAGKPCFVKDRKMAGLNEQKAFQLPIKLNQVLMLFKHKEYSSSVF